MSFRSELLAAAAMILLICAAYSRAPFNGVVWDDDYYLTPRHLADVNGLKHIWSDPSSVRHPYYPLTRTSLWLENRLFGLNLKIHHSINVLLHILGCLLVWRILKLLRIPGAWLVAAVFGVHPVSVESVAWITERKNVLGLFFYLTSTFFFLKFLKNELEEKTSATDKVLYYLSLVLFLCALLTKTAFCTLPLALLVIVWWQVGRFEMSHVRLMVPYFMLALILGLLTTFLEKYHAGAQGIEFQFSLLQRTLIAGHSFWFYLSKIIFPYPLNFMYPSWEVSTSNWIDYTYAVSAAALLFLLWFLRHRIGRGPLAAVLFFIVNLLPALGFINFYLMRYTFVADHLQYAAMLGILTLVISGFYQIPVSRLPRPYPALILSLLLFSLAALTWIQTGIYKDLMTLYNDVLKKNASCWLAYNNRGLLHLDAGNHSQAISDFNHAVQLNPHFEEAYVSRGHYYFRQGQYDQAFEDFSRAIQLAPGFADAYRNRGAVFFARGKYKAALEDFNRALYLNPDFARAYMARGAVFSTTRNLELAILDYNRAIALDPFYGLAYLNRSRTLLEMGRPQQALSDALIARSLGVQVSDAYLKQVRPKP